MESDTQVALGPDNAGFRVYFVAAAVLSPEMFSQSQSQFIASLVKKCTSKWPISDTTVKYPIYLSLVVSCWELHCYVFVCQLICVTASV